MSVPGLSSVPGREQRGPATPGAAAAGFPVWATPARGAGSGAWCSAGAAGRGGGGQGPGTRGCVAAAAASPLSAHLPWPRAAPPSARPAQVPVGAADPPRPPPRVPRCLSGDITLPRSTPPGCRAACPPRRRRGISQPSPGRIKEKYTSKQTAAATPAVCGDGASARAGPRCPPGAGPAPGRAAPPRPRRQSRFEAALSNLVFRTSPVVQLPLSEERSCFLLFPLKSSSRSLAGSLLRDGTARAGGPRPAPRRAAAALRRPGARAEPRGRRGGGLRPGREDEPARGHLQLDGAARGGDVRQLNAEVLGVLRGAHGQRDGAAALRVEGHQQAVQQAAGLPGGLGRPPALRLPQRAGGAVHLPEPPPLLPQLHAAAPGLRPPRGRAAGHDRRPHLPHPLPRHPRHLAQQGRQGAALSAPGPARPRQPGRHADTGSAAPGPRRGLPAGERGRQQHRRATGRAPRRGPRAPTAGSRGGGRPAPPSPQHAPPAPAPALPRRPPGRAAAPRPPPRAAGD